MVERLAVRTRAPLGGSLVMLAVGLVVGIVIGVVVEHASLEFFLEKIFPSAATLLAAFLGASLAFDLQWRKEENDRQEQKIVSANIAIFTLAMQANALHNLKTQYVDPYR